RRFVPDVPVTERLTEADTDRAHREMGIGIDFDHWRHEIRKHLPAASASTRIYFLTPPEGLLYWVGNDYAAAHYSLENNAMYISLPLAYRFIQDLGEVEGLHGLAAIGVHEDAHLRG